MSTQASRYFIRDCHRAVVGNPKGYATHKAAEIQANKRGSPAMRAIWENFNAKSDLDDANGMPAGGRLIYSIHPEKI